jgi:hypothetical protein
VFIIRSFSIFYKGFLQFPLRVLKPPLSGEALDFKTGKTHGTAGGRIAFADFPRQQKIPPAADAAGGILLLFQPQRLKREPTSVDGQNLLITEPES